MLSYCCKNPRKLRSPVRPDGRRRGVALLYAAVMIMVIIAFVSFAVDYGRVQTAKMELRNAIDAAARYAVIGLRDNTTLAKAQAVALQNKVDGTALSLQSGDVEIGTWDATARTFTLGGSAPDAVRITGRRTAARGNPIPLIFARAFGRNNCDINAVVIATQDQMPYSMVALNSISMATGTKIQRKSGETGTVIVGSNGAWTLSGTAQILGDALYRGANVPPASQVTGTETAMGSDISYSAVTAPPGATNVGAVNMSSGSYTISTANYLASSVILSGSATFNVTGNVNIYCSGNLSISGNCSFNSSSTNKLTIYMTGASSTISFTNNLPANVVVYAPNSTMTVNAPGKITGSFVCKTLTFTAGTIEYTSALPIPVTPTGGGAATAASTIASVK